MITVREATALDADQVAALNHAFNAVEREVHRIRQSLLAETSPETVLVAEEAGAVIGFLCLQTLRSVCYDAPWVEITEVYVAPTHRGRGAGQALVRQAEVRAEKAGASELLLRTNHRNAAAQTLFKRMGLDAAPHVVFRRFYAGAV
jgi:ribosomal protein S18 acetylase RimI-like enzyme